MLGESGSGREVSHHRDGVHQTDPWGLNQGPTKYRSRRPKRVWPGVLVAALFILLIGLSLFGVYHIGYEGIISGDGFQVRRILIDTDGVLTEAEIADAAEIENGSKLTLLKLADIEEKILSMAAVESAEVSQQMPDSLLIRVSERAPIAWLSCPDHGIRPLRDDGLLIDKEGIVFACGRMEDGMFILPTIELFGVQQPVVGSILESTQLKAALELIAEHEVVFSGQDLRLVDIRSLNRWGLLSRYSTDLIVTYGVNRVKAGVADLSLILAKAESVGATLTAANVAVAKNIPVTFENDLINRKWQNSSANSSKGDVKIKKE